MQGSIVKIQLQATEKGSVWTICNRSASIASEILPGVGAVDLALSRLRCGGADPGAMLVHKPAKGQV